MGKVAFVLACVAAFIAPLLQASGNATPVGGTTNFPPEFEGRPLREVGLTERESYFLNDFPGQIGRFSNGRREIIIRRVTEATRKLHPAADCFKAIGYSIEPLPLRVDEHGKRWSAFTATRDGESLQVYERIEDNSGREWTDVSNWYWSNWGEGPSEWWAWTVAERKN